MKLSECTKCPLCETRTKVALPRGDGLSGIMLLGEAPGQEEDQAGTPFVGPAGKLLSEYITKYFAEDKRITEDNFWITNTVKCRPTEEGKNRPPSKVETMNCYDWLEKEIARTRPWLIVCLGATATKRIRWEKDDEFKNGFKREVGKVHWDEKRRCAVLVTFHPSYVLRDNDDGKAAYECHFEWIAGVCRSENWWWQLYTQDLQKHGIMTVHDKKDDGPW